MRTAPIARRPARLSQGIGAAAGAIAFVAAASSSVVGGAVAAGGLLVLAVGLVMGTRRLLTLGGAGLLVGVLVAGLGAASAATLLLGVAATVLAWDVGGFAVDLGAELGREADTHRVEVVHATGSAAVALATAGLGYGVYLTAGGSQPVAALLLLLLAGVVLLATLDRASSGNEW